MNYRKKAILMVLALFCLNIAMLAQAVSLKMNNVSDVYKRQEGNTWSIEVKDTGIGIPSCEQKKLFRNCLSGISP